MQDGRGADLVAVTAWPPAAEPPAARYEGGANIAPSEWIHLRVDVADDRIVATVDGETVLTASPLAPATAGDVGLFVDIGTEAHFRDLRVRAD